MNAAASRYLFDVSFDAPQGAERIAAPPAPPPRFTDADLEAARAAALAEGRAAALDEARNRDEARLADAIEAMAAGTGTLLEQRAESTAAVEAAAIELTLAIARKMLPELAKRCAFDELAAIVRASLDEAFEEPRLVVRTPDALFDAAKDRISAMAEARGYAGKIVVLADPLLGPDDVRVEWADGGAERDMTRLWAEIDEAAKRAAETLSQPRGDE